MTHVRLISLGIASAAALFGWRRLKDLLRELERSVGNPISLP